MYEIDIENDYLFLLENVGQICRVCLDLNQNNQCIFSTSDNDPENINALDLVKKLNVQGGIEIQENDGLPSNICLSCTLKVNAAHEFREQCQLADRKLRKAFEKFQTNFNSDSSTPQKNLHSQTEDKCLLLKNEELQNENSNSINDNFSDGISKIVNDVDEKFNYSCDTEINSNETSIINENDETIEIEKENAPYKKEGCKTRKMSVFKRVTSMENLKNFKERQRQYIKKNVKSDQNELNEFSTRKKNRINNQRLTNEESELNFECNLCNITFSSKRSLDKHTLIHNEKKYNCDKCDKEFSTNDKLLEHSKLHQPKEKSKPVRCKICEKSFKKTDTMVRHLNIHKRANPKEVFSILKEIRDRRKMENNVENKEINISTSNEFINNEIEETKQNENICTKELRKRVPNSQTKQEIQSDVFQSDSNSESDHSLNDMALFRCKNCTKCYTTEKSLQRHMLIHDEKKFICNVCNMKFFRPDRLKSHRDRYGHNEGNVTEPEKPADDKSAIKLINSWIREELDSDNEGKGFSCDLCGKSYVTKKSLAKHRANIHETQRNNYCKNCGINCNCDEKKKIFIKPEKTKIFTCNECGKSFEKENKLQKHLQIHERAKEQQDSNFKRFLCHICSKTFRQNTGLMFHMRTHTGYKPHVCKYCGRGFTSNSNCINHERTHTGDRPFVCHFCSAAFAKSCTLKAHITTHTGEANYHCKTCGKSFRRLKYLKEHKFTHTGEKPYACKICGTAYSHSGSLFVHEKKCKAQFNNFQPATSQNGQNFCQSQTNIVTTSSSSPLITLPSTQQHHHHHHHVGNINNSLGLQGNKTYIESVQRMSAHAAAAAVGNTGLHVHANTDVSDMASAVRNFAIIGQMFH